MMVQRPTPVGAGRILHPGIRSEGKPYRLLLKNVAESNDAGSFYRLASSYAPLPASGWPFRNAKRLGDDFEVDPERVFDIGVRHPVGEVEHRRVVDRSGVETGGLKIAAMKVGNREVSVLGWNE